MQVQLYQTLQGIPTDSLFMDLGPMLTSVSFSHDAMWGPTEASVSLSQQADEWGQLFAGTALGLAGYIYNDYGELVWGGRVTSIAFGSGNRRRRYTLEGYANHVKLQYHLQDNTTTPPTDLGPATPITADDVTGQLRFGVIEEILSEGGMEIAQATRLVNKELAVKSRLNFMPDGQGSGGTVEIGMEGWYSTLYYQSYTQTATATNVAVSTLITTILAAKCPFILSQTLETTSETFSQYFDQYDYAGDIIKALVATLSLRFFQITNDRYPVLVGDNRFDLYPHYYELADGTIKDPAGVIVDPTKVRPNTVIQTASSALEMRSSLTFLKKTTWSDYVLSYETAAWGLFEAEVQ